MDWKDEKKSDRIIVALDCEPYEAFDLGQVLAGHVRWVKVGMTLYYATGPSIVRKLHAMGFKVMVDLKLHDIPYQVYGAAQSLGYAGADLITVHASGGEAMMSSAQRGARKGAAQISFDNPAPAVCAITVLTSMDDVTLESVGVKSSVAEHVKFLAKLANGSGLDGVVCSPQEAADMRALLGPDALVVTPGVRPEGTAALDQSRVATPAEAFAAGASHLVIGRPITRSPTPVKVFDEIAASVN